MPYSGLALTRQRIPIAGEAPLPTGRTRRAHQGRQSVEHEPVMAAMTEVPGVMRVKEARILRLRRGDVLWVRSGEMDLSKLRETRDEIIRLVPAGVRVIVTSADVEGPVVMRRLGQ